MQTIKATNFMDASASEWEFVVARGSRHYLENAGNAVLDLLQSQRDDDPCGWQINAYHHALQCATRALRDGEDEEFVVAALLHDVMQGLSPFDHDALAGRLLRPFLKPENVWMVEHHQAFQLRFRVNSKFDTAAHEQYRGHPHFERALHFCARYDQKSFDGTYDSLPIATFEPMVRRVFGGGIATAIGECPYRDLSPDGA
jgi:predicted HD phosphohydrolase